MSNKQYLLLLMIILSGCHENIASKPAEKAVFEKIVFHSGNCYGLCPVYHLQIDSSKNIHLFAETVYKNDIPGAKDTAKMGYFTGLLNDSVFSQLNKELKKANPDSLIFDGAGCCDAPMIVLIIYYNGKRKYLYSMFPPEKAQALISALYSVCENSKLTKTNQAFEIEFKK